MGLHNFHTGSFNKPSKTMGPEIFGPQSFYWANDLVTIKPQKIEIRLI